MQARQRIRRGKCLRVRPKQRHSHGAAVLAREMGAQYIIASGSAFKDAAVGRHQIVVSDVVPLVGEDVKGPDGADPGCEIGHGAIGGVMDD